MYGWIGSNCMMTCTKKYRWFNVHLGFAFNCITWGGGGDFIINTAKRCLLRLIKLQPGECVFLIHVGKFFPSFSYPPRVVFESVHLSIVFLDLPFSPTQILHGNCFTEKKTIQGSLHLICIINMLHKSATCERKRNKCSNKQDGSPHPPNAWWQTLSSVKCAFSGGSWHFLCCLIML